MLFPRHPPSVSPRREVAAMVVAHRRAPTIVPGQVVVIPEGRTAPELPTPGAGSARPLSRNGDGTPV